jgi:hypothetical protein
MSANEYVTRVTKGVRRRHRLTREAVDALPWPHPRPARDWRLVGIHLALIWTAVGQAALGPPENSVQWRGFGWPATIVFGVVLTFCCVLYLMAAFCKSQYESFGYEAGATVGFAGTLGIYGFMLVATTPNWALTYNWSFTVGLAVGNAIRGWILVRRLW